MMTENCANCSEFQIGLHEFCINQCQGKHSDLFLWLINVILGIIKLC